LSNLADDDAGGPMRTFARRLLAAGATLVLARTRASVRELMRRAGIEEGIGPQNFHLAVTEAVGAQTTRPAGPSIAAPRDGDT
jgi:hypothetical protein